MSALSSAIVAIAVVLLPILAILRVYMVRAEPRLSATCSRRLQKPPGKRMS